MKSLFDLENYLTNGVEHIIKDIVKATLKNPTESLFISKYVRSSKKARKKRYEAKQKGEHIPPFLIASITSSCNLHCSGCYARANHSCSDHVPVMQLSSKEWEKIFYEARDLGISFILLAGGEPMIRQDVMSVAGEIPEILFPVFTNGTLINQYMLNFLDQHRNIVPIISIEGKKEITNNRRGQGIYEKITETMDVMNKKGIVFGTSVTVTTENLKEVTSQDFLTNLSDKGCKVVFYVEFVPVSFDVQHLALSNDDRLYLQARLDEMREKTDELLLISFPGDEKSSGGCLAAGRGFFHINSHGNAEPCPFSPYSDINVRDTSLREALKSKLFLTLQDSHVLTEDHKGGCILFERKDQVEAILNNHKEVNA